MAPERYGVLRVLFRRSPIPTALPGATIGGRFLRLVDNDPDLRDPRVIPWRAGQRASNGIFHPISRVLIPVDL